MTRAGMICLGVTATIMLSVVPAGAAGQTVRGEVLTAVGSVRLVTQNNRWNCELLSATATWAVGRGAPCQFVLVVDACRVVVQGVDGHRFKVDPTTYGDRFTLTPREDNADLEITFIMRSGDNVRFDRRFLLDPGAQIETGRVPRGAQAAEVCIAHGAPTAFTYRAGS